MELEAVYMNGDGTLAVVPVAATGTNSYINDEGNWMHEAVAFYLDAFGNLIFVDSVASAERYGHFCGLMRAGSDPEVLRPCGQDTDFTAVGNAPSPVGN